MTWFRFALIACSLATLGAEVLAQCCLQAGMQSLPGINGLPGDPGSPGTNRNDPGDRGRDGANGNDHLVNVGSKLTISAQCVEYPQH